MLLAGPAAGAAPVAPIADSKATVLAETFDAGGDLQALGWNVEATAEQSEWRLDGGRLLAVCHRKPYKGGRIWRTIPRLARGSLEFDVRFAVEGSGNYNHLSLGFRLYGHMTSFKKYAGHKWLAYRPSEKRHDLVSNRIPLGEWVRLRMVFDAPAKRIEYYIGDNEDPVWVDTRADLDPERAEPRLEFFNYGLCAGTVTHWIDNVVLRRRSEDVSGVSVARNRVLLFEGISADRYRIGEALAAKFSPEFMSIYAVLTRGAAISPRNQLALRSMPGAQRWREATLVVLADVPAGPGDCVPDHVLASLAEAVRNGADLLVFGGMFALGKGGYAGTALQALLPVSVEDRWAVKRFPEPALLQARDPAWKDGLGGTDPAAVLWYHDTPLTGKSPEVILEAGGKPMLVRGRAGRGTVTVFLGVPCGEFGGGTGNPIAFWEWPGWPGLVRRMTLWTAEP